MERFRIFMILGLAGLAMVTAQSACKQSSPQQNPVSRTSVLAATPDRLNFTISAGTDTDVQQALTIVNKGTGDLNWAISDDSPWIVIQQASGTSGSQGSAVNVVVNAKNMDAGNYTGILTIVSDGALNSPVYVPVLLSVVQPGGASAVQQTAPVMPSTVSHPSSTSNPPGDTAAVWNNKTELYRYAGGYSCNVSGTITNTDAIWYMGDVQIITQSGKSALISDSIAPGQQVTYYRVLPCYDNDAVRLSYKWYRP